MGLKMNFRDYISLVKESISLDTVTFSEDATREEVIRKLMEISDRKLEIKNSCDAILDEYVFKFERTGEILSDEEYLNLRDFAAELAKSFPGSENVLQMHIAKILLNQNIIRKNREQASRNVAMLSVAEYDLDNRCFIDGVGEYAGLIPDFLLDSKDYDLLSRQLLFIGLGNYVASYGEFGVSMNAMKMMINYYDSFSEDEKKLTNVMSAYAVGCKNFYEEVVYEFDCPVLKAKTGKPAEGFELSDEERAFVIRTLEIGDAILNACPCHEEAHLNELEIRLYMKRCEMYLGLCTPAELIEYVRKIALEKPAEGLTSDELFCKYIMYPCMEIKYRYIFMEEDNEEFSNDAWKIFKRSFENVENSPNIVPSLVGNNGSSELMYTASYVVDFEVFREMLFKLTVCENIPLHIHTKMVEEIMLVIGRYILRENPSYFIGVMGYDKEYILAHKYELIGIMSDCAKLHDIGKLFCLDYTSIAYRQLLEEEFNIIKLHTVNFAKLYAGEKSEKIRCVRDCARMHHRYYNSEGGYMDYQHTKNKPLVNILSVADSIDAATDTIGRPYARRKTFEDLICEFREMAGTRYDKYVCDIIEVPEVREKIRYIIEERRKDINYEIYTKAY